MPLYTWVNIGVASYPLVASDGRNGLPLACDMVKQNIDVGVEVETTKEVVPLSSHDSEAYRLVCRSPISNSAAFRRLADISYAAIAARMVELARKLGRADGGCILVTRDAQHAELLRERYGTPAPVSDGDGHPFERETGVRVVPYNAMRGFNWAARASIAHLVTSAYPGNYATYTQMVGRIKRFGTKRTKVFVHVVLPAGTVVQLLNERHTFVDQQARAFEALGSYYGLSELGKMLADAEAELASSANE